MFNRFCNKHSILSYPARSYVPFKQWYAGVIGMDFRPLLLDSPLHSSTVFTSVVAHPSSCEIIFFWPLKLARNLLENWKDTIYSLHYFISESKEASRATLCCSSVIGLLSITRQTNYCQYTVKHAPVKLSFSVCSI